MELTSKSGLPLRVEHNEQIHRYEVYAQDKRIGLAEYIRHDDAVLFTHTEVSPEMNGEGIGTALIKEALDDVREAGLTAVPICPFVVNYVEHNRSDYLAAGGKVRAANSADYALLR
ncbi:GNAT family N-acetyltransferase [Trueperella pyogenes]|uniref:GNAT family N-acetyltransferase n=1 Tax=Trueperella pyogenes TaxID=1661 RepID=A0ABV3N9K4_9ACTO|nr:GNAT family N-acetyltransferase [Trueperella pyogenes]AHU89325.1 GCN5 family acetyltransferase [Trueperella pyogenes]OQD38298.1 N-acetyltransferase [Trueperella pyogenes]WHU59785.1 GNAT family N-acetyltransferase [Trueperella pyogenes]